MNSAQSTVGWNLLPWKAKLKLRFLVALTDYVSRSNGTVNRRLLSLMELFHPSQKPHTVGGVRAADISVDAARGLWFRLFLPMETATEMSLPVLVFFHGGGFAFMSAAAPEYDALCRQFCRKLGVAVVSVNYRLSPEHRFPAQYEDGIDVLRFMESGKATDFPGQDPLLGEFFHAADLSTCFLAGDSAGANIAHHVAARWTAEDNHRVQLAGLISIQPFFGGEARVSSEERLLKDPVITIKRSDWSWKAFLPEGATRDHPAASPSAAAADLGERFPPVMVVVGNLDPLQDWQRTYFESLKKNDKQAEIVEYQGAIHVFYLFPELKHAASLIDDAADFVLRQISRRRGGGHVVLGQ